MTKTFEILNFGHWNLFAIWDLLFVIYGNPSLYAAVLRISSIETSTRTLHAINYTHIVQHIKRESSY
jgi:hypothetical protein